MYQIVEYIWLNENNINTLTKIYYTEVDLLKPFIINNDNYSILLKPFKIFNDPFRQNLNGRIIWCDNSSSKKNMDVDELIGFQQKFKFKNKENLFKIIDTFIEYCLNMDINITEINTYNNNLYYQLDFMETKELFYNIWLSRFLLNKITELNNNTLILTSSYKILINNEKITSLDNDNNFDVPKLYKSNSSDEINVLHLNYIV
jgi:hypothetical protein